VQTRPIHPVNERGELRCGQSHHAVQRTDVVKLLDQIAEDHGPRQADAVYTVLMSVARWYASRSNYIVAFDEIRKHSTAKSRDRTLDHDEIRTLWAAAEHPDAGQMGAIVRLCLLTAQRKAKVATMRWSNIGSVEIDDVEESREPDGTIVKRIRRETIDGVWCVPQAPREKEAGGALILPEVARTIIEAQPRLAGSDYVFSSRSPSGHVHTGMFSLKESFDKLLPPDFKPYRLHDLRRSARSLMSAAKCDRDAAERTLGHKVAGKVEGTYDRFPYIREKGEVLQRLADYIAIILAGPTIDQKVVPLESRRRAALD
jgi:integrase